MMRLIVTIIAVLSACLFPGSEPSRAAQMSPPPDVSPEMLERINRLANLQKNLTKRNTPGAELNAKEVSRASASSGSVVGYEFFAKNLPKNLPYVFGVLRITGQIQALQGLKSLDAQGKVMEGPDDPLELLAMAAKGEPYRVQLASQDGKYRALTSVIPFPISSSDKKCSLEAVLLLPDAEALLLQGNGFHADTAIHIDIDSEGEKHNGDVKSDEMGSLSFLLMPYKKGMRKGVASVSAEAPDCHPKVQFTWGKGTYHTE